MNNYLMVNCVRANRTKKISKSDDPSSIYN